MSKLKVLIPSYNRVAQLHLLLESLERNFADFENLDIHVLWRTNDEHFQGYRRLILSEDFPNMRIEPEYNFQEQVKKILDENEYVLFFTDDCVFYREFSYSVHNLLKLITDSDIWSLSLRLGLNTTIQYYITGQEQPSLDYDLIEEGDFIKWNWKIGNQYFSYFYMMSWDGHIYKSSDLLKICNNKNFNNPREFESLFAYNIDAKNTIKKRYMISPIESCVFCNTINCCQDSKIPAGMKHYYSLEMLNCLYNLGNIIDLDKLDFSAVNCTHGEIPLQFKKKDVLRCLDKK